MLLSRSLSSSMRQAIMKYLCVILLSIQSFVLGKSLHSQVSKTTNGTGKGIIDFILGNGPKFCNCVCGKAAYPEGSSRIVGGFTLATIEYPWIVIVNIQGTSSHAATLISDRYVLTAASQVLGLTPYDVKVTTGKLDRCFADTTSANRSVSDIIIHPNYDPIGKSSDIALLRLSNIIVTDRWTSPICLPQPGLNYQATVVETVGWGEGPTTEGNTVNTCNLRRVGFPVINFSECFYLVGNVNQVTPDKSCVGTGGSESLVCSTDAGAPIQYPNQDGYFELVGKSLCAA